LWSSELCLQLRFSPKTICTQSAYYFSYSIVLYDYETWKLRQRDVRGLKAAEMIFLRRMLEDRDKTFLRKKTWTRIEGASRRIQVVTRRARGVWTVFMWVLTGSSDQSVSYVTWRWLIDLIRYSIFRLQTTLFHACTSQQVDYSLYLRTFIR
jgi:hypothetical protein